MPTHNPSCAVAFPRYLKNATDAESATDNATAIAPNARKPASILELRAQLRAQPERNQEGKQERASGPELRPELRPLQLATDARRHRVLAMLADLDYLREYRIDTGGRPKLEYWINPKVKA